MKCHSERSEESASGQREILRFAQNDISGFGCYNSLSRPKFIAYIALFTHLPLISDIPPFIAIDKA